jgi:hypothetical protein
MHRTAPCARHRCNLLHRAFSELSWSRLCALAVGCALTVGYALFLSRDLLVVAHRALIASPECDLTAAPPWPSLPPFPRYERAPVAESAKHVDFVWVSNSIDSMRDSLSSVCYFYKSTATLHLIVPDGSEKAARLAVRGVCDAARHTVRVWNENDVVPAFRTPGASKRYPGTLRQMILKLAAATECVQDAAWYVVMDSDVYARRFFSSVDLVFSHGGAPPRARTDFDYPWHAQPKSWSTEAGSLLGTRVAADTHAWCAAQQSVFGLRAPMTLDAARPFALTTGPRGQTVYGACHSGRGGATHVTPMIMSVELIKHVLAPRLEARAALLSSASASASAATAAWYESAFAFQEDRIEYCRGRGIDVTKGRFYAWTEYSLYFVAAVAAEAIDSFHDFGSGALLSFAHSAFDPLQYDFWSAEAVLDDDKDTAPLFLVHGWMEYARTSSKFAVHELFLRRGIVRAPA